MKIGVIGSRNLIIEDLGSYIPSGCDELVSGGALGVDRCVREFAEENEISLTEFLPEYELYKRAAPLIRNDKIIEYSDELIAFWDGKSKGTKYVIDKCRKLGKKISVYIK